MNPSLGGWSTKHTLPQCWDSSAGALRFRHTLNYGCESSRGQLHDCICKA